MIDLGAYGLEVRDQGDRAVCDGTRSVQYGFESYPSQRRHREHGPM